MTEREASLLLRRLREESGLTQKALGEAVGKHERTILNAENPEKDQIPQGITVLRMLEAMEVFPQNGVQKEAGPLARLEAAVAERPTRAEFQEGLHTLRVAIDRVANRGTGEAPSQTQTAADG